MLVCVCDVKHTHGPQSDSLIQMDLIKALTAALQGM